MKNQILINKILAVLEVLESETQLLDSESDTRRSVLYAVLDALQEGDFTALNFMAAGVRSYVSVRKNG